MAFLTHIGPLDRYALRDAAKPPEGEVKTLIRPSATFSPTGRRTLVSTLAGAAERSVRERPPHPALRADLSLQRER
jgi:hypothetical protein